MRLCAAPLFSGSSGNSTYIGTERTGILIDAGLAGTVIAEALRAIDVDPSGLDGILVTHEHSDHIKGIGVLSRRFDIPVYANAATWEAMEGKIGGITAKNIRVIDRGDFFIGDMTVTPIPLSHDAADPTGYAVFSGGRKVSLVTDSGRVTKSMLDAAASSDIVLLESNHDVEMLRCGRYPYYLKARILSGHGHLSNEDSACAACELVKRGVRGIILAHLSKDNNLPELAFSAVSDGLGGMGAVPGRDVSLAVARRSELTGYFPLG